MSKKNDGQDQMDNRCPRKLECHPDKFCPLAVLRLKALRNAGRELTEQEENALPGCPWAVNHQVSNYCFFKYMSNHAEDRQPSEMEIAAMLNLSIDTVKKIEKTAIQKMREDETFANLKGDSNEAVVSESSSDDYKIHR